PSALAPLHQSDDPEADIGLSLSGEAASYVPKAEKIGFFLILPKRPITYSGKRNKGERKECVGCEGSTICPTDKHKEKCFSKERWKRGLRQDCHKALFFFSPPSAAPYEPHRSIHSV
ncbi:MAG: hypothetical protein V7629_20580, partial [Motiliproteus sp.]